MCSNIYWYAANVQSINDLCLEPLTVIDIGYIFFG